MKNTECTIYITTKHGWIQRYRKEKDGWTQTCSNGTVRPLSAEQLLSHILPPLAAGNPDHLSVRVVPDDGSPNEGDRALPYGGSHD
jgi:hypothetical protein